MVEAISRSRNSVRFQNSTREVRVGHAIGANREAIFEAQIRYTIEEHIRKQLELRDQGIKVLSLFFIDQVANYADADGVIRRLFAKAFDELKGGYPDWADLSADDVAAAYFAQKRRRNGTLEFVDSTTGRAEEDEQAYDLIMRDKENLLTFPAPDDDDETLSKRRRAFVFSHSALKEGWDNPNVFQICTLNQTSSDIKKRQEVGRGMRLCVNQGGTRVFSPDVNILTVVANESYEKYVEQLQKEIADDYGTGTRAPKIRNARDKGVARPRGPVLASAEFKELWRRISQRTRYAVSVDTDDLVTKTAAKLNSTVIAKPVVVIRKAEVDLAESGDKFEAIQSEVAGAYVDLSGQGALPDLIEEIGSRLQHTTPPMRLTRATLHRIIAACDETRRRAAVDNPQEFVTQAADAVREVLAEQLVNGIKYTPVDEWYKQERLEQEPYQGLKDDFEPADRSLHDLVPVDSDVEREFVRAIDRRKDVRMFLKLPPWFTVPTPVGEYRPDWGLVMNAAKQLDGKPAEPLLYLVSETKGATGSSNLRGKEVQKIKCGARHFEGALKGVRYKVVTKASELP